MKPAVSNVIQAVPIYSYLGHEFTNTLHFHKSDGWTVSDMNAVGESFNTWFDEVGKNALQLDYRFEGTRLTDLSSPTAPSFIVPNTGTLHGATVGIIAAINTAMTLTFSTGGRGRSRRGRIYVGGLVSAGAISPSTWSPSYMSDIQGAYTSLFTIVTTDTTCTHCIVSYVTDKASNIPPEVYDVTSIQARSKIATQRTRV